MCTKFCYLNGTKCSNVLERLHIAFDKSARIKKRVCGWRRSFWDDCECEECPGRFSMSTTDSNLERAWKMLVFNCPCTEDDWVALKKPTDRTYPHFIVDEKYIISVSTSDDWTSGRVTISSHKQLWFTDRTNNSLGTGAGTYQCENARSTILLLGCYGMVI